MYKGEREKLLHSNIIDINCLAFSVIDFHCIADIYYSCS